MISTNSKYRVSEILNTLLLTRTMVFNSLEDLLDHYADGGVSDLENQDLIFKKKTKIEIALTIKEKSQLIAFVKTLTNEDYLKNKRFAP